MIVAEKPGQKPAPEASMLHPLTRPLVLASIVAAAFLWCYDFHLTGPEDAAVISPPQLVSVTIEYRQPAGCVNSTGRCDDLVVFFGSWMQPGREFFLARDGDTYVWRGRATNVPVNYPPRDEGYEVRIYDPHLVDTPTGGFTAERLRVGGESLTRIDRAGGPEEHARVFVDANGQGHNAF
jgi:hypothetical protein